MPLARFLSSVPRASLVLTFRGNFRRSPKKWRANSTLDLETKATQRRQNQRRDTHSQHAHYTSAEMDYVRDFLEDVKVDRALQLKTFITVVLSITSTSFEPSDSGDHHHRLTD